MNNIDLYFNKYDVCFDDLEEYIDISKVYNYLIDNCYVCEETLKVYTGIEGYRLDNINSVLYYLYAQDILELFMDNDEDINFITNDNVVINLI